MSYDYYNTSSIELRIDFIPGLGLGQLYRLDSFDFIIDNFL